MVLTERERITILMMRGYGDKKRSFQEVQNLFNIEFPERIEPISRMTVKKTLDRFNETGSVKDRPKSGRPVTATNEEIQLNVALSIEEDCHTSTRKLHQQHDVSVGSIHYILKKKLKFHPFKINLVHKLNEDDPDRRVEFCDKMMDLIIADASFPNRIVFSDEATFFLNGHVNRHNMRYWSANNPHWMTDCRSTQYPLKINVWAGIVDDRIVGPFFIDDNLTAAKYETMLQNDIIPAIQNIVGNNFANTWFQQDGAAPHYGLNVRAYLNNIFPSRWIGRRGEIEWPPRSPDLTPLDFFFWGYLKDRVYRNKPASIEELKQNIRDEVELLDQITIKNAVGAFYHRLAHCQQANGEQFEHLL